MREVTSTLLDPVLPPTRDRMILDAGCGTGGMLTWLARYAGEGKVVGIDLVSDALRFCRARQQQDIAQASVVSLPFADATFDVVTSFDVLVQLPSATADTQAIGEMYRVLRPGGIVYVRVAAHEWMRSGHDKALGTQRRYTLPSLSEKLEAAGFTVLRATYANMLLLPVAMLRRLALKRIGLADSGSDVKPLPPHLAWLNTLLRSALVREARLLKRPQRNLTTGLSATVIAEKPRP